MRIFGPLATAILGLCASAAIAQPSYKVTASAALGAPDRWDYVVFDASTKRIYVAHGDRVTVVDPARGTILSQIAGIAGGTHGVAISPKTGQGFTDDGKAGTAVAFDLQTLAVTKTIAADLDADGIASDAATGNVFVIEGDPASITIVDPKNDVAIATIKVGEKLEYAIGDDQGMIYVAGEEKGDLVKIDARTNTLLAHYPAPGCTSPHGLAIDNTGRRLFMGCANSVMMAMDADTGRGIATLPIGRGNDAIAYDPVRHRIFSSNGLDGTMSVFELSSPDRHFALEPIPTAVSGRTMALDPQDGRLFMAAAEPDPSPTPGGRPKVRPGTLKPLVFDPLS